ncbi:hypothetical protein, partial [Salmonella enterica]|uniref:hypothetical protein n=1 Tax=Salmonella enterica TaxID=28901 RepID=UPI0021B16108
GFFSFRTASTGTSPAAHSRYAAGTSDSSSSYLPFRFPQFQEKAADHQKPQHMGCSRAQNTPSRYKRSTNDPLLLLAIIFMFPLYGIFPESGKSVHTALRVFPVASGAVSDENSHRTSPDRAA